MRSTPPPVYEVNDVDRDERGRIVHAEDSTLAEVLAQTVDLVPEERRADLMFFLIPATASTEQGGPGGE